MSRVVNNPRFASIGTQTENIDVRLSYRIVELFSEGLYASPNKAIEELVANSFDAGARQVQVMVSSNLHDQDATIVVIDDGDGMDAAGLKAHWLIGISDKRRLSPLPKGRQQIGRFGIGKLATYVLAERLTHICKRAGKYFSTSMNYTAIDTRVSKGVEPVAPIKIPLRELREDEAKEAIKTWTETAAFKSTRMALFGKRASDSWTVAIMSSLKPKVHEIRPSVLEWVLRTAMPLRPDFRIWLNGTQLVPSKHGKGLLKKWTLGKDMVDLPRPCPKGVTTFEDTQAAPSSEHRFGFNVPGLGHVTGVAEAYNDLLTGGKSDEIGRSNGFFVYVFGRLVNVIDGHFGISPNELRHGTFNRFRLIVHMNGLDEQLRSNREAISEGPLLSDAQDVLRAIFNYVRSTLEKHDEDEEPGARLARKLAASPASLSRSPIVELAKAVVERKCESRYLIVPECKKVDERNDFVASLEQRAEGTQFVTGLTIDYDGSQDGGIAQYETATGVLKINAWHPFVATFYDEFVNRGTEQPLQLLAMAEVLAEAHLYAIGVKPEQIGDFLSMRDQLLRNLANESGQQSVFAIALALRNARNDSDALEEKLCAAFKSLGFETTRMGKKGKPDGVATAFLSADAKGKPRQYSVSLEAKSKEKDQGKVAAGTVKVSAIIRQRDDYNCQHALVVGRDFPKADGSALAKEIADDRTKTAAVGEPKTITLITIDTLAELVKLRPIKQIGLLKLRELFENCQMPTDCDKWVDSVRKTRVKKPPYKKIVETIAHLHKTYKKTTVEYAALRVELSHLTPPIYYEDDSSLMEICKGMAQMSSGGMYAVGSAVELDQSVENVIAAIDAATREHPIND
jgi:hypothetical protein